MTRARVAVALAAALTALLLQATVIGPIASPVPVSLPAVLIAAVALVDGPGAGMAFGFSAGLLADLASTHPAGVLALCWTGVGIGCGLAAGRRSVRRDAATAAIMCAVAASAATLLLAVVSSGGATAWLAVRDLVPTGIGDALLALAVVPLVLAFLSTDSLRAAQPAMTELSFGGRRG
ncbi:MAG: rod shape-determining protein MreD [Jatrophihabitantaceae bacterium]